MAGYMLFNGKGNCNSCHVDGRSTTLTPGQTDTGTTASVQPLFTCHGFANEGLPLNPRISLFYESTPDGFGFTPNPDGFRCRDLGLGNFLRSGPQTFPDPNQPEWLSLAPKTDGQMQVMTARDVAMTPPQCPTTEAGTGQPYFQKEFFHNGYIKSLKQLVHFYNTRELGTEPQREYNLCVPRHVGALPGRNGGKGDLLAATRGPEQPRHDDRCPRLDGYGGEPDRSVPANADGRLQPGQPDRQHLQEHQYLYRYVLDHLAG